MPVATARSHAPRKSRRPPTLMVVIAALAVLFAAGFALLFVVYVLWPRWPQAPVAPDAPTLPIVVGGTLFNVPSAALRVPVQRRAGTQERIDLVFVWPALTPPEPDAKPAHPDPAERIFVTIAPSAGALSPAERLKTIYPRYLAPGAASDVEGLRTAPFRAGSPYQGEDLVFDLAAPERFSMRCMQPSSELTPATCLHERVIGGTSITVRLPRGALSDWRAAAQGMDRLMAQLQSPAPPPR